MKTVIVVLHVLQTTAVTRHANSRMVRNAMMSMMNAVHLVNSNLLVLFADQVMIHALFPRLVPVLLVPVLIPLVYLMVLLVPLLVAQHVLGLLLLIQWHMYFSQATVQEFGFQWHVHHYWSM